MIDIGELFGLLEYEHRLAAYCYCREVGQLQLHPATPTSSPGGRIAPPCCRGWRDIEIRYRLSISKGQFDGNQDARQHSSVVSNQTSLERSQHSRESDASYPRLTSLKIRKSSLGGCRSPVVGSSMR